MTTTTIETAGLRIYVLWGSLPGQGSRCRAPRDAWERAQVAEIERTYSSSGIGVTHAVWGYRTLYKYAERVGTGGGEVQAGGAGARP
jgi:hypothetical protein